MSPVRVLKKGEVSNTFSQETIELRRALKLAYRANTSLVCLNQQPDPFGLIGKKENNMINLADYNYYGLDHEAVANKYEGELKYVGTWCMMGSTLPYAVYGIDKAARTSGNLERYMLLYQKVDKDTKETKWFKQGFSKNKMNKNRHQNGVYCKDCDDLIYSVFVHDFRTCKCGKCWVDGGNSYLNKSPHGEIKIIDMVNGGVDGKTRYVRNLLIGSSTVKKKMEVKL